MIIHSYYARVMIRAACAQRNLGLVAAAARRNAKHPRDQLPAWAMRVVTSYYYDCNYACLKLGR